MAFGVVEHGPGWAALAGFWLAVEDAFAAELFDGGGEVGDFEEQYGFIGRGIIFRAFAFEAEEGIACGELCVMASGFSGERESENVAVEFFCAGEVFEIELNTDDAEFRGFDFGHAAPPAGILHLEIGKLWRSSRRFRESPDESCRAACADASVIRRGIGRGSKPPVARFLDRGARVV